MQKKSFLIMILCQVLVLAIAFGNYLLNRGNTFSKIYAPYDFTVTSGEFADDSVIIDSSHGGGNFLTLTESLEKGVYIITVNYVANSADHTINVSSSKLSDWELRSDSITLNPGLPTTTLTAELTRATDDLTIHANFSGNGSLAISEIRIIETTNYYLRGIFYALCLCAIITLIYVFYHSDNTKRKIIFCLSGIFLFSCYPLMTDYMLVGHDLPFHLLRIEGIYHGLVQGTFPVKIHPVWAQDYGYAVGVFYGDAFLYIPAFLRILGFSIQTSYKFFVAIVNLATVLISYFCFKKIFQSSKTGLIGSALYSFSLYRLADVYTRAAVGEYTALTFLPIILCGLYLVFTETNAKQHWFKHAAIIAIGLTGVVQSHVLTCEMLAIFILPVCIILIKKTLKPYTFLTLASSVGMTLLMNLGFLIPFLDYFNESIYINSPEWGAQTSYSIQDQGMFPVQLLGLMHHTYGGSWATSAGVYDEASYSLGLVLTLCIALFLYIALCLRNKKNEDSRFTPALLCCGLGIFALYMCTCYFPWNSLATLSSFTESLISKLQFPWRFLAIATILLLVPSCYAIAHAEKYFSNTKASILLAALASLFIVSSGWYFYEFSFTGTPYRVYDTYELNSMTMYSYEYLPTGTDPSKIAAGVVKCQNGTSVLNYYKDGTFINCTASAGETEGSIEFPLNYYEDYVCVDSKSGEQLPVDAGFNNMVRVTLPANYSGHFEISFKEPVTWRIAEMVSWITLAAIAFVMAYPKLKYYRK